MVITMFASAASCGDALLNAVYLSATLLCPIFASASFRRSDVLNVVCLCVC